jgi:hypothetical protein
VESNEYHFGGNIGAVATGQYGQATGSVHVSGAGEPLRAVEALLRKLEAEAGQHLQDEQAEEVVDDVHRLQTELRSRRPSAEGIRAMLARLTAATGSAAALLATVEQIKELVLAIVH